MKRFKIFLSKNFFLSFSIPVFDTSKRIDLLAKTAYLKGFLLLSIFCLLLPLVGSTDLSSETNYFKFFIAFSIISYGIYLFALVLNGRRRLADPKNVLNVLIFALLTTTAAVFVTPSSITNTFGTQYVRALSGIFIICAIGFYYLTNVYVRDLTFIKRLIYLLTSGFVLYFLYLLMSSYQGISFIITNFLNVAPLFILLSGVAIFSRIPRKFSVGLLIFISTLTLAIFSSYKGVLINVYYVLIASAISGLILSIYFLLKNPTYISSKISELKMEDKLISKGMKSIPLLLIASPIFILLFGFIIQFITKQNFLNVFLGINDIAIAFNNISVNSTSASPQIVRIFVGLGGLVLNPDLSVLGNAIASQGIIGAIAYIFLIVSSLMYGFKVLGGLLKRSSEYKLGVLILFVMLYSSIISLFIYPGILTIILWWIGFSLMTVLSRTKSKISYASEVGYYQVNRLRVLNGKVNLQYVLPIVILVLFVFIYLSISRLTF